MKKSKKPLWILLVVLDVAIITFFLVLSIMILMKVTTYKENAAAHSDGLVRIILDMKPILSFFVFVLPMFLVLAANIIGLMVYVRKTTKKEPAKLQDLSEEQKEALRKELLKDLQGDSGNDEEDSKESDEEKPAAKKKAAAKKAPAKKEEPEDDESEEDEEEKQKPTFRNYHVSKRAEDGKWTVKFAGGEKVIKLFDTQKEALEYTKKMAENQGGSVLVHNSKGANKGRIKSK